MGAEIISKDAFESMIRMMDADGSGSVDEEEFKSVYAEMFPNLDADKVGAVWKQIDEDGDGNLTVQELAKFFGFNWDDSGTASEMTDEQILNALQMHAALQEKNPKAQPPQQKSEEPSSTAPSKDTTLTQINTDRKKNKDPAAVEDIITLDEAIKLGDLVHVKDEAPSVERLLAKGIPVRYEDEKGEGPFHKFSRLKLPAGADDSKKSAHKRIFLELVKRTRDQAAEKERKLYSDINHQDKQGKTPLHVAIEHKNYQMIDLLFDLGRDGPDSLLVNAAGWTILHFAAQASDLENFKKLFTHLTGARKQILLRTKDKTLRTPLHIASFKDASDNSQVVDFLLTAGALNDSVDTAGNLPSTLAGKSGRRASKELIEERTNTVESFRSPRASKEGSFSKGSPTGAGS